MRLQTNVRFLLAVTVLVTLCKSYKLDCSSGSASNEVPTESKDVVNLTETWTWLHPINTSEPENNSTVLWDKVLPVQKGARSSDDEGTNWCMRVGVPFEKVNFSRFQLTNKCCKEHVQSVLVDINNSLRYKCADESEFYDCLKMVNSTMSRSVGHHYFNTKPLACYKIEEQDYCLGTLCSLIMKISASVVPVF